MKESTETKNEVIRDIVEREWNMFSTVNNQGGKASCQSRPVTFELMRRSQFAAWSLPVCESYLEDLKQAEAAGRNLCTEKYAYMLESMCPEEYEKVKALLPETGAKKLERIREIVAVNLEWERNIAGKYEKVRSRGRALTSDQDTPYTASVETYMTGEMRTYSEETIRLLYEYTLRCRDDGRNLAEEILENTAAGYGYGSLEEAEKNI